MKEEEILILKLLKYNKKFKSSEEEYKAMRDAILEAMQENAEEYHNQKLAEIVEELNVNILECENFEKNMAKKGEYTAAIKLVGMQDAFKKIRRKISLLTQEEK